jgi:hypothetical protein
MDAPTERHAITADQRTQLQNDLAAIEALLQSITVLMCACYGAESQPAVRAEEAAASLQRLKWELERMRQGKGTAG